MEEIKVYLIGALIAAACGIGALILVQQKNNILKAISDAILAVENEVTKSGMGEDKKKIVIARLEVIGIKLNFWVNAKIDWIVAKLNESKAWPK